MVNEHTKKEKLPKKGISFLAICIFLLTYGYKDNFLLWIVNILFAILGFSSTMLSLLGLTFTILSFPELGIEILGKIISINYMLVFLVSAVVGVFSYIALIIFEPKFSSQVDNYKSTKIFQINTTDRESGLLRILACRIKYIVFPYLLVVLLAIIVALYNSQFVVLLIISICVSIGALLNRKKVLPIFSKIFFDRALTPLTLNLIRLIALFLFGLLLINTSASVNIYSLILITTFLGLSVNIIRCANIFYRLLNLIDRIP